MNTHEELLAKFPLGSFYTNDQLNGMLRAIRAVVELHKPIQEMTGWGTHTEPRYKTICNYCKTEFPCVEFQAIDKELK